MYDAFCEIYGLIRNGTMGQRGQCGMGKLWNWEMGKWRNGETIKWEN